MELKKLKEISKNNLEFVKDYYLENNSFQPMIIIYTHKNSKKVNVTAILEDNKSIENRFEILSKLGIDLGVRTFLKKEYDSVDAVFTLNEAWMTRCDKKEEVKKVVMPSENPNRMEVLMSVGLSSDKKAVVDIKIIRKIWEDNGVIVNFEELNQGEKEEDLEIKSNLLESFWETFKLIEGFSKTLKKNDDQRAKREIKEKTSEELVDIYTKMFYQFIENNVKEQIIK